MNDNQLNEALSAWPIETQDLTARVSAAIGASQAEIQLANEIAALRREVADLRSEITRFKAANPKAVRITPFCASENAARLS